MRKISGFLLLMSIVACNTSEDQVMMNHVDNKWDKKNQQKFNLDISDPENAKNIIFVVRNNNEYPYSNIRFIVNFGEAKSNKKITDTLNYVLAKPNGEWIGKGFGDTKETLFQYKINYKFPKNGDYQIGVVHGMRTDNLKGIEDIGVKIESVKP